MSMMTRIRGLWRFDGDTDPVRPAEVSRRRFLFLGACAAAGAVLPWPDVDPIQRAWDACIDSDFVPNIIITSYDSFFAMKLAQYRGTLAKDFLEYRPSVALLMDGPRTPPPLGEWPRAPEKGTREWYKARHEHKHARQGWQW